MNSHVAIAVAVFLTIGVEWLWRHRRKQGVAGPGAISMRLVGEVVSPSGRFKVSVFEHGDNAYRVQPFSLVNSEPTRPFWIEAGGSSIADSLSVAGVAEEALRAVSGEPSGNPVRLDLRGA